MRQSRPRIEFFRGLSREHLRLIADCASNVHIQPGVFVARAGDPADRFWAIREGRLAIELYSPGRGAITIDIVSDGDVVGFSWLLPPYHLTFDVHALTSTRAVVFDGRCLRA